MPINPIGGNIQSQELNDNFSYLESEKASKQKMNDFQLSQKNALMSLDIPTYEGSGQTTHPSVLYVSGKFNGYNYWMAHTPYPNSNNDYENPSIVVSNNGMEWIERANANNPIDQPTQSETDVGAYMSDPELILVNGQLECIYRFNNPDTGEKYLFRKTSTDGDNWSTRETIYDQSITAKGMLSPTIVYENSTYRMWYTDTDGKIYLVESATGELGSWSAPVEVPLTYKGEVYKPWHLQVFKDGSDYKLILNGFEPNSTSKRHLLIGFSTDGTYFDDIYLLMSPSKDAYAFDNNYLYRGSLINNGKEYMLYYGAYDTRQEWRIGMSKGSKIDNIRGQEYHNISRELLKKPIKTEQVSLKDKSHLTQEELLFHTQGVKSVKLINTATGELEVQFEDGTLANLNISKIGLTDGSFIDNEKILLRTDGVKSAQLVNSSPFTLEAQSESGGAGNFKSGAVILGSHAGTAEEGMIRYNISTKKHEGYDGSTWNPLY